MLLGAVRLRRRRARRAAPGHLVPPRDGGLADPGAVRGFLLPALLVYPSVHFFAERSMRQLVETRYAVEAMSHPQTLQDRLQEALAEIDALPGLPDLVAGRAPTLRSGPPRTERRVPALEPDRAGARAADQRPRDLRRQAGALVSRFALELPRVQRRRAGTGAARAAASWDIFGEALLFGGAQERNTLHAQRSVCVNGEPIASIVVHVVFDYRTLPFISSQSAYFDVFGDAGDGDALEGSPAGDVDFTVYGWGLTAIYTSAEDAWPLDDATFARVYRDAPAVLDGAAQETGTATTSTSPTIGSSSTRSATRCRASFDHLVRLAELTTLAAVGYVLVLVGNALFTRLARARAQTGRALLREIRASFYRKLFLAFVLASIVPVLTLALVIRTYFAGLLRHRHPGTRRRAPRPWRSASSRNRTRCAARRRGQSTPFNDDVMVWISQLIDQDVNVFDGAQLHATSERDLFASGLLPTRTPDDVYRAIVAAAAAELRRARTGSATCRTCSPPRRCASATASALLTVPLALRQHEVEREIDDARSRRPPRRAVLHPARRRRSGCRWPSASPIRSAG